ncbi:hypothetical protein FRC08_002686 [Ceratobasidium sp. 394]|nr:hypothetical protein FRC08_002686 [Ceratobasidium sp. 394]
MPSLAGFYATREDCLFRRVYPGLASTDHFRKQPLLTTTCVENRRRKDNPKFGLMLVRRYSSQKEYLDPDPVFDAHCKRVIEEEFDLPVFEWSVVWYDDDDPDMMMALLAPGFGPKP